MNLLDDEEPERSSVVANCRMNRERRAASWLSGGGLLVASLNLANVKLANGRPAGRRVAGDLRRAALDYDHRRRLVTCRGRRVVVLHYRYLGADDRAGPNVTGQPAVDSYYEHAPVGPG